MNLLFLKDGADYLTNVGGSWEWEVIAYGVSGGKRLLVDDDGHVHVCLMGFEEGVYSATNASGAWELEEIDAVESNSCSIDLDSSGYAHIVYNTRDPYELKYATNETGAWVVELMALYFDDARILLDDEDYIHIMGGPFYMSNQSGSWVWSKVVPSGRSGFKLGEDDTVHAAFGNQEALWYGVFPQGYTGGKEQ